MMKKQTEILREEFKDRGLSYSNIYSKEIGLLTKILKQELSDFDNDGFKMSLCKLRQKDIEYKEDGSIKKCYFMVDGCVTGETPYFRRREAISFNTEDTNGDGFIGFAGWSDSRNITPFVNAFRKFIDEL